MIYLVYLRVRLQRLSNMLGRGGAFKRFRKARAGTAPKSRSNPFLTAVLGILMLLGGFSLTHNVLETIESDYDRAAFLVVAFVAAFFMTIGSREFARTEWDMEWLITLPISKGQLIAMRLFERTVMNPVMIFFLYPMMAFFWISQSKVGIPLGLVLGLFSILPFLFTGAVLQTLVDTGLRVRMKSSQLRNLQAVFSVLSIITFYSIMPLGKVTEVPIGIRLAGNYLSPILIAGPISRSIEFATHCDFVAYLQVFLFAAAFGVFGFNVILWLLRDGVAAGSGQISGARGQRTVQKQKGSFSFFSPMPWKESKLLSRDKNYMVQTLLTPLLMLGMQIYLRSGTLSATKLSLPLLATTAFATASYAMLFSAFQILTSEGPALWILYTFPVRMKDLLVQKAKPWLVVALIYWCAFAAYGFHLYSAEVWAWAAYFATALLGIGICLVLAVSLGVFSFEVSAVENVRKVKASYIYLYMLLASSFASAFFLENHWNAVVGIALIGMVAFAFWQKANDYLPFLLDATAAPKPEVTLADGIIAVYAFFVLQIIFSLFLDMFSAFGLAGLIVFGVTRYFYHRNGTTGIPTFRATNYFRTISWGLGAGLVCAIFGTLYLRAVDHFGLFDGLEYEKITEITRSDRVLYSMLAIVLAPIFEEFIFRGLIFQGLQKSLTPLLSIVISAVIFACVHPIPSVIPVLVVGIFTAVLARSQKTLLAPAVAHATYNLSMVAISWLS